MDFATVRKKLANRSYPTLEQFEGNQYRPTKIPLVSVRPFEYTEIILKDEPDIDSNDQNSILVHLDKVSLHCWRHIWETSLILMETRLVLSIWHLFHSTVGFKPVRLLATST